MRTASKSALLLAVLAGITAVPACSQPQTSAVPQILPGKVMDLDSFRSFIAMRPSVESFRARYPDVRLVLPGDIATKELRTDNSRFFATIGADGRIDGGKFM